MKWTNCINAVLAVLLVGMLAAPAQLGAAEDDLIKSVGKKKETKKASKESASDPDDLIKQLTGGSKKPAPKTTTKSDPQDPRNRVPRPRTSKSTRARVQLLEILSGERTANLHPDTEIIVGPPLSKIEIARHMLNRAAYGPRPGQVMEVVKQGWENWLEEQLHPEKIDDSKLDKEMKTRFPWLSQPMSAMEKDMISKCRDKTGCSRQYCSGKSRMYKELPEYVVMRSVHSKRQLQEVMTEFWRNHFSIDQRLNSNKSSFTAAHYEEHAIRANVMGKFSNLLMATAHHPAMLEFLDNWISRKGAWNENYAREVMELHTLGVDSFYNENDVLELTKVLTGWTFKWQSAGKGRDLKFVFNKHQHEIEQKRVLGRAIPEGYKGGQYALMMLAYHPGTADFISYKLCRYLVNDTPPPSLVKNTSRVFKKTKGDLREVYKSILTSEEFLSRRAYRSKFKTPFEFAVSALRATDAKLDDGGVTASKIALMGQAIYHCPDPTGYYDQAEAWLDSGVLTRRWDYALQLVRGDVKGVSIPSSFYASFGSAKPEETKDMIIKALIGDAVGAATDKMLGDVAKTKGAKGVISALIGSPAFQQQ